MRSDGFLWFCGRRGRSYRGYLKICDRLFEIDFGAAMVEMDANIWIPLRGFDDSGIKRGTTYGVDRFVRIAVVGEKMKAAGFVMDHTAAHRNGVTQHLISNTE